METKTARTIMRCNDVCIAPTWTLDKVSDHLTKHQIPGAPVTKDDGTAIGYISEYDCLQQLMQANYYCDNTAMAEDVMSKEIHSISPDMQLMDVACHLNTSKLNVVAVMEEGQLLGIIPRSDVMRALVENLDVCVLPEAGQSTG